MANREPLHPKFLPLIEPHRYKVAYGGRASRKSWAVAEVLIELSRRAPLFILCTREIQKSINESVKLLLQNTIQSKGYSGEFEILKTEIRHAVTGSRFVFAGLHHNPDSVKSMEGIDICWVEEAQNVPEESWQVLIPTIRKDGSEIWVTFNPRFKTDFAYERFILNPPPDCVPIKINYTDHDTTGAEIIAEAEHLKRIDFDAYRNVWLGEPVGDSAAAFIRYEWIESAIDAMSELGLENTSLIRAGLDVADTGQDLNAMCIMNGIEVSEIRTWGGVDVIETARLAENICNSHAIDILRYDSIGVGAGVRAYMNKSRVKSHPFIAGEAVQRPDSRVHPNGKKNSEVFQNAKAQAWYALREKFVKTHDAVRNGTRYKSHELISISPSLKDLDGLISELSAPNMEYTESGKIKVESKADLLKRGIKSPNMADALVMASLEMPSMNITARQLSRI